MAAGAALGNSGFRNAAAFSEERVADGYLRVCEEAVAGEAAERQERAAV
jgi:hypothetical protein